MTEPSVAGIRGTDRGYRAYHAPRFRHVLKLVSRYLPEGGERILDVGPSPLSELLARELRRPVDTLGLEPEGEGKHGHHFYRELNRDEPAGGTERSVPTGGDPQPVLGTIKNAVYRCLPAFLREGITLVLRRSDAAFSPPRE